MVSDLKTVANKGCRIAAQKKSLFWGKLELEMERWGLRFENFCS